MNHQIIKKTRNYLSAFSLIEMMVSISVIVLITAVFMANYQSSNKRSDLIMTAQKIVVDIRAAQNNSLGLNKYGDEFPAGGWAMNFDVSSPEAKSRYIMFADLDSPASNEPGREAPADYYFGRLNTPEEDREDYGAKTVSLPSGIVIDSLDNSERSSNDWLNINFLPPDPVTHIFDGVGSASWGKINLKDERSGDTQTIFVNFLGLAEVVD